MAEESKSSPALKPLSGEKLESKLTDVLTTVRRAQEALLKLAEQTGGELIRKTPVGTGTGAKSRN